ncbi:Crp/Fnr family transcriptional regulator [Enterococcus rivorum]|uniref:HTH crp-type domain-containing protein n=1 Tax=Enterococcus rivorum TaxID=762845 RepID=A0A1E5KY60_9ENTE|nr:Crp/Fnr family transcriptional regulator [Enterococcus rivorum]MBP2099956.1 CRP-like cAMP-binding protein [Enterococcus rivorum]OEH82831.1 hypothetical protein BCR26_11425 [Enterococcus rivorum]
MTIFYLDQTIKEYNSFFLKRNIEIHGEDFFDKIHIKKSMNIDFFLKHKNLYYINSGSAMRHFIDVLGNRRSLNLFWKSDIIGFTTLFDEKSVEWETIALTDMELIVITHKNLLHDLNDGFQLVGKNFQYYTNIMYCSQQCLSTSGCERINFSILSLAYYLGNTNGNYNYLPPYITHDIISCLSAVTRSYVTRHLKKLITENIISIENRKICINNIEDLTARTPSYQ